MFLNSLHEFPGIILDLFTLPDTTFYHLLGILVVIAFLRIFVPLHQIMTKELTRRNEVADLAEKGHCSEFDIFVRAHKYYYGSEQPEKIKNDFIVYLWNWPENYILPFYIRNFLENLNRDSTDSRPDASGNDVKKAKSKLPDNLPA